MVQKEVKTKAQAYGLIGILSAAMLVALIYSFGAGPGIAPPNVSPSASPFESPGTSPITSPNPPPEFNTEVSPMNTFGSYDELKNFLTTNSPGSRTFYSVGTDTFGGMPGGMPIPSPVPTPAPTSAPPQGAMASESTNKDYSTTNIQVAGVDEADTVKTDGKYLYVIANNTVYILDANPQNAKVLQKIKFENGYVSGIYLSMDGNKLAVLGNSYMDYRILGDKLGAPEGADIMIYPYYRSSATFVYVYDVSNKAASPQLSRNFTMSGNYHNSRLIGNYVYNIVTEYASMVNETVLLPTLYKGTNASEISATSVYYAGDVSGYGYGSYSYSYTTFVALNIMNDAQEPANMTIMLGGADTVYVSQSNIYVTYPVYEWQEITPPPTAVPTPAPTGMPSNGTVTIMPAPPIFRAPSTMKTSIYRIYIAESSMTFAAQGNVTGSVLNQYAMDENGAYFRIATTAYDYSASDFRGTQQNNVYVLDMNLVTVGKLENLGTGENFHAARFMGNRLYLVTFMKTDPLFVIDLTNPANPTLLGELIIPGYSDYLHPYDETHLIGLGKEAVGATEGDFAWYQGLKLSLFDVSNVNAPREMAQYIIGDRGTNSPALYDPKAFLFDHSKNLLVIPVELYLKDTSGYTPLYPTYPGFSESGPSAYGTFVWQGAYVFRLTLENGFELRGRVTQIDGETLAKIGQMGDYYYYGGSNYWITRTLYIGSMLYTISDARVQLNSLDDFALIAKIELN